MLQEMRQGRYAEAESTYTRAQAILENTLGPEHTDVADILNGLALTFRVQGRYREAEPLLLRALSIRERALRPDHHLTQEIREALNALRSKTLR